MIHNCEESFNVKLNTLKYAFSRTNKTKIETRGKIMVSVKKNLKISQHLAKLRTKVYSVLDVFFGSQCILAVLMRLSDGVVGRQ